MVSKDIQVYHSDLGDWYKLGEMETAAYWSGIQINRIFNID